MNLRRAAFITAFALACTAGPAAAQLQPAPQREPPCIKTFSALRDSVDAKGKALMAAQKRKVPLSVACKLLGEFTAAQEKMLKYVKANTTWCGIPPQIAQQLTVGHANADRTRIRICKLAANPPRPAGPTLSDALNTGIPDANNIKTGRGTFDTLTGTPLGK
jgi:hypothetical protein